MSERRTMRRSRRERGGAVVELALGSLAFISILLYGIHFSEVGFLSLKATEAANFAIWDATGRRQHEAASNAWNLTQVEAVPATTRATQKRYKDLDGRADHAAGNPYHYEALTKVVPQGAAGELLNVNCKANGAAGLVGLDPGKPGQEYEPTLGRGIPAPNNGGTGIGCTASVVVTGYNMPRKFLQKSEKGFFNVDQYKPIDIRTCAVGRARNGSCDDSGRFSVLLDDWGMEGYAEGKNCHLNDGPNCANPGYYQTAKRTFEAMRRGAAGTALDQSVGGSGPNSAEDQFWMSFQGQDSPYGQPFMERLDNGEAEGYERWQTSPLNTGKADHHTMYYYSWRTRSDNDGCFLGLPCR